MTDYHYLIVGAGMFGSVMACELAKKNKKILLIDKRSSIGGNCHSEIDSKTGIEFHCYGTHIFHTDSKLVWDYVNGVTKFTPIKHKVETDIGGERYPLPFNLDTFSKFFKRDFTALSLKEFLKTKQVHFDQITNLEQQALSMVGSEFFEAFIKGYTEKHWGEKCSDLPSTILKRIPISFDNNRDYFKRSQYQGLPEKGFNEFFKNLTNSPLIEIMLNTDFFENRASFSFDKLIYTGPLDQYFNYKFGELKWRGIELTKEYVPLSELFTTSVCNFPEATVDKTRTHIPRLLYPYRKTSPEFDLLIHEKSCDGKHAQYYPMRIDSQMEKLSKYEELKREESNVIFGGRLANYAYLDMDQVISQALIVSQKMN